MYTDPLIVSTDNMETRAYVKVYIDGERHRFYNGKSIGINCNPNHAKTLKDRNRALTTLSYELKKKLEAGWHPGDQQEIEKKQVQPKAYIGEQFSILLDELEEQDLSKLYKRDISLVGNSFVKYLKKSALYDTEITNIHVVHIDEFLKQYKHSATYYMNKRRTLSGIFSRLVSKKLISNNPVHESAQLKEKAALHQAYTKQQLHDVLEFLKANNSNLHLCALLMYGCFLRPHQEIRQLYRKDFNETCTVIALAGASNKSGKIRTVHVPVYVLKVLLQEKIHLAGPDVNLFTGNTSVYNDSYFNTMWSRVKEKMMQKSMIGINHTLYSFRHTAAVNLYMKTKDLFKVQQALGHSSMAVTLTYMRSLGIINNVSPEDVPDL